MYQIILNFSVKNFLSSTTNVCVYVWVRKIIYSPKKKVHFMFEMREREKEWFTTWIQMNINFNLDGIFMHWNNNNDPHNAQNIQRVRQNTIKISFFISFITFRLKSLKNWKLPRWSSFKWCKIFSLPPRQWIQNVPNTTRT